MVFWVTNEITRVGDAKASGELRPREPGAPFIVLISCIATLGGFLSGGEWSIGPGAWGID